MQKKILFKKTIFPKISSPKRVLSIIFFLLGISLLSYPAIEQFIYEKQQIKLLTVWDQFEQNSKLTQPSPESHTLVPAVAQEEISAPEPVAFVEPSISIDGLEIIGVLTVDKVEMREPILGNADEDSLRAGIGVVEEDRSPGVENNFVLAGHRSRTYGKQFNRLAELEAGDTIQIQTTDNQYVYSVTETFIVKEDDLSVLDQDNSIAELTLITCEYDRRKNPTLRLIVKAHLESSEAYGG